MSVPSVRLMIAVGVAALGVAAFAAAGRGPAPTQKAKLQKALDELVAAGAPGAIVLARDGDRTIRLASGYGNLKTRAPIRLTDRFRIGSVTKTFVAAVVYRALLGGRLLRPELLREMEKALPLAPGVASGYGLGVLYLRKGEGRALGLAWVPCASTWGHDGGTPGYRTWGLNSQDGKRQVVVLANLGENSLSKRAKQALDRVIATAFCG